MILMDRETDRDTVKERPWERDREIETRRARDRERQGNIVKERQTGTERDIDKNEERKRQI